MVSSIWAKLAALAPGSREAWRHYTGEIAVVVIGVLIALGADQAVRYISARAETAAARERIRNEMNILVALSNERIALDNCAKGQIATLADGLASGRTNWSSARFAGATDTRMRLGEMYHVPDRSFVYTAYREAIALGQLEAANREERAVLASIYTQAEDMERLNKLENELITELSALQFNPVMSQAERNHLLTVVARLDRVNGVTVLISSQLIESWQSLDPSYHIREDELPLARKGFAKWAKRVRGVYGNCVDTSVGKLIDHRLI